MTGAPHRTGVVALLGAPNAGKSTLLNRLLGEKLAIVTHRPQTTRSRILGILSRPGVQILLVDTPGLHHGGRHLNTALNAMAGEAADDCDLACVLVDLTRGLGPSDTALLDRLRKLETPFLLIGTKADRSTGRETAWPPEGVDGAAAAFRISARTGEGVDALLDEIGARLPEAPPLYPEDDISDRPMRFLAAEWVREAVFEELGQELPYAAAVEVIDYDEERQGLVRIRANLIVERDSQKRIAVGTGGEMVKRIGIRARRQIESLVGSRVHLELRVKVEPGWQKKPGRMRALGYR